jgi:hypothetical protein
MGFRPLPLKGPCQSQSSYQPHEQEPPDLGVDLRITQVQGEGTIGTT